MAGKGTVKATAEVNGKFAEMIMRDGSAIKAGRGKRTIDSASAAQLKLIMDLQERQRVLEDKRELMLDNSPDNTYSLKVGESFDGPRFVAEYQRLSIELINLEVEIKIAVSNNEELFGA